MPKVSGMVAPMKIQATVAVADAVRAAMGVLTYDEIAARGGPSSPTLTKILRGDGRTISSDTARKLEHVFDWPRGRVAQIASGQAASANPIAEVRHDRQLSREEMAEALEVSEKAIAAWEAGSEVPAPVLARLARLRPLLMTTASDAEILAEVQRRIG